MISEADLLAKVKNFQVDAKTPQSGYLFEIHKIVLKSMDSSKKPYKMFLDSSESLLELH